MFSIGFWTVLSIVIGGSWDNLSGEEIGGIITGVLFFIAFDAFVIYMFWSLGWFAQRVDRKEYVDAAYDRLEQDEYVEDGNGNMVESPETQLARERTGL